jgi:hypothetical protein
VQPGEIERGDLTINPEGVELWVRLACSSTLQGCMKFHFIGSTGGYSN